MVSTKGVHQQSSKGLCLRYSFYVLVVEHQALREARVFGFEGMSYDHKFGFLRVRTEFINSHPLREI